MASQQGRAAEEAARDGRGGQTPQEGRSPAGDERSDFVTGLGAMSSDRGRGGPGCEAVPGNGARASDAAHTTPSSPLLRRGVRRRPRRALGGRRGAGRLEDGPVDVEPAGHAEGHGQSHLRQRQPPPHAARRRCRTRRQTQREARARGPAVSPRCSAAPSPVRRGAGAEEGPVLTAPGARRPAAPSSALPGPALLT